MMIDSSSKNLLIYQYTPLKNSFTLTYRFSASSTMFFVAISSRYIYSVDIFHYNVGITDFYFKKKKTKDRKIRHYPKRSTIIWKLFACIYMRGCVCVCR